MHEQKLQKYIKSFSKGQITVPKDFRDYLGLGEDFWLKLYVDQNKIIAEPVENSYSVGDYSEDLLSIKGNWYSEEDTQLVRDELEARISNHE
jgi:bifunctional DNA-binding transcriptional regulator/antitoxin component of YhaV-PrlF toxin-antitoxin module